MTDERARPGPDRPRAARPCRAALADPAGLALAAGPDASPPMGRENLDCCAAQVAAIERSARPIEGPIILVAHSGGVSWSRTGHGRLGAQLRGALLATPADFDQPMPEAIPSIGGLCDGGWLPVPRDALPFHSIVAASRNDPLARYERVAELAAELGQRAGRPRRGRTSQSRFRLRRLAASRQLHRRARSYRRSASLLAEATSHSIVQESFIMARAIRLSSNRRS